MGCLKRLATEGIRLRLMEKLGAALLFLFAVFGPGCSSNDQASSQADCRSFIETWYCPRAVACNAGPTDQAACVSDAQMHLDCAKVTGENADTKMCMTDLSSVTCASLVVGGAVVLPASCQGVFQLSP